MPAPGAGPIAIGPPRLLRANSDDPTPGLISESGPALSLARTELSNRPLRLFSLARQSPGRVGSAEAESLPLDLMRASLEAMSEAKMPLRPGPLHSLLSGLFDVGSPAGALGYIKLDHFALGLRMMKEATREFDGTRCACAEVESLLVRGLEIAKKRPWQEKRKHACGSAHRGESLPRTTAIRGSRAAVSPKPLDRRDAPRKGAPSYCR
jgi:hypothetical protein